MKNTTEVLSEAHDLLAHWCVDKLREGDLATADLNVIRQFLKDNQK